MQAPEFLGWLDQHRWLADSHNDRGILCFPIHISSCRYRIGRGLCHNSLEDIPNLPDSLDLHDSA